MLISEESLKRRLSNSYMEGSEQKSAFTSSRIILYSMACGSDNLFNLLLNYMRMF